MLAQWNDIKTDVPTDEPPGVHRVDTSLYTSELLADLLLKPSELGTIEPGKNKHFYSRGAFNLVQLVLYILRQTGSAHVFISTYSIAEESLATLMRHKEAGDIRSIRFLIDNRVRSISPKPFDFLATAFPHSYRCRALHAKVALIYNDRFHISVVGSQNATHNPKLERGIVHTDKQIFDFDLKCLTHEFNQGTT
ncbi:MAG: hypothetical protein RR206_04885 [Bacteroidaceae bacterium]